MLQRVKNSYPPLVDLLWILVWLGLPLTSFPILGWLTNSQAAPFSAIPLGIVLILWFFPRIIRGRQLPSEVIPILGFSLAAIVSSAAVNYLDVVSFEGHSFWGQSVRALFTLGVGLAFYMAASAWLTNAQSFRRALQCIHIGGAIMLVWGLVQTLIIFTQGGHFPIFLEKMRMWLVIQYYAVREGTRVASLAYEPSWFAHQLNMLYLPLWLAATYLKQSVFRFRFLRLSIENILLIVGVGEFLLSRPRIGLLAFLLMVAFLFLKLNISAGKKVGAFLIERINIKDSRRKLGTSLVNTIISLFLTLLFIGLAFLLIYTASRFDQRLALLFTPIPKEEVAIIKAMNENTFLFIGQRLQFLERVVYWLSGWHIFRDYPIFGVGLGNAGFFIVSHVPPSGWMTTELRDLFYRLGYMVNTKSYWFRILAETGLVGLSFFLAWLTGLWRSARYLMRDLAGIFALVGLAGQLALLAFVFEGFSLDSFALPYVWVTAGLISAARMATTQKNGRLIPDCLPFSSKRNTGYYPPDE